MQARIYQPARTAMQSGSAKSKKWLLEYAPSSARKIDPLMGWTSSSDTYSQVQMTFESCEAAISYAKANGLTYIVSTPNHRRAIKRPKGYGENFAYERRESWTH